MKKNQSIKPKRLLSVSGKILIVILIFVVITLGFTWALQFLLLNSFYAINEKQSIKNEVEVIAQNIENEALLPTLVERIARTEGICIWIGKSNTFSEIASEHVFNDCEMHTRTLEAYFNLARQSEDEIYFEEIEGRFVDLTYSPSDFEGNVPSINALPMSSYTYAKIVKNSDSINYIIVAEGQVTPMPVVRRTLVLQLISTSLLYILFSLLITVMLAKTIAAPLIGLNEAAKDIPKGDADFDSVTSGYTEIQELKDTLSYTSIELNKLEGYRKELVANVSHDIRTPLALIKGYSEMMKDIPSEANPENIQVIIDETTRLASLVNDMLNLSRLQEGGDKLRIKAFDLVYTLDEMLKRHGKLLKAQGYELAWEHEEKGYVYADEIKIVQVIYNLINNAVNYSGEDKKVTVRLVTNGLNIRVEVIDNGEGVDVDILPHIWDRYYKSEKSHKRAVVGTGLGLSIVKSVMNMHPGGVYGVITSKGEGSTFYIELPKLDPTTMDIENDFPEQIEE